MDAAGLLQAISEREQRDIPGPYRVLLSPNDAEDLRANIAAMGLPTDLDPAKEAEASERYGTVMGVPIWYDYSVPVGTVIFVPEAL